jgi:hypothetical protein
MVSGEIVVSMDISLSVLYGSAMGSGKMVGHWNSANVFLLPGRVPCLFSFRGAMCVLAKLPQFIPYGQILGLGVSSILQRAFSCGHLIL